jgi:hypothetical protein
MRFQTRMWPSLSPGAQPLRRLPLTSPAHSTQHTSHITHTHTHDTRHTHLGLLHLHHLQTAEGPPWLLDLNKLPARCGCRLYCWLLVANRPCPMADGRWPVAGGRGRVAAGSRQVAGGSGSGSGSGRCGRGGRWPEVELGGARSGLRLRLRLRLFGGGGHPPAGKPLTALLGVRLCRAQLAALTTDPRRPSGP